jgi:ribosomal protein S16
MHKKYIIKIFKIRRRSKNNVSKLIVVGFNNYKVNGGYLEKLGSIGTLCSNLNNSLKTQVVCSINLRRLGFWLNKGALLKSKVSWLVGLLSVNDKNK